MRDLIQIRRDAAAAARTKLVEALTEALRGYDEAIGEADADLTTNAELRVSLFQGEPAPASQHEPEPETRLDRIFSGMGVKTERIGEHEISEPDMPESER